MSTGWAVALPIQLPLIWHGSRNDFAYTQPGRSGGTSDDYKRSIEAGNTPQQQASLDVTAAGGPITYTSGDITNNDADNAFDVQQNGAGTVVIEVSGSVKAASGAGIFVHDTAAGGSVSVTTGAVTTLRRQ